MSNLFTAGCTERVGFNVYVGHLTLNVIKLVQGLSAFHFEPTEQISAGVGTSHKRTNIKQYKKDRSVACGFTAMFTYPEFTGTDCNQAKKNTKMYFQDGTF